MAIKISSNQIFSIDSHDIIKNNKINNIGFEMDNIQHSKIDLTNFSSIAMARLSTAPVIMPNVALDPNDYEFDEQKFMENNGFIPCDVEYNNNFVIAIRDNYGMYGDAYIFRKTIDEKFGDYTKLIANGSSVYDNTTEERIPQIQYRNISTTEGYNAVPINIITMVFNTQQEVFDYLFEPPTSSGVRYLKQAGFMYLFCVETKTVYIMILTYKVESLNVAVGDYERFLVNTEIYKRINSNCYSDTIISTKENKETGIGNNSFKYNTTNLLQVNSTTDNVPSYQYIGTQILKQYANGKETAVIQCAIGEYYDTDGNLAISTVDTSKPMVINDGDIVVPYTYTEYGEKPLSVDPVTRNPKQFVVVGHKIIADGSITQEITLQEYVE